LVGPNRSSWASRPGLPAREVTCRTSRRASASGPVNTLRDEILVFAERKEQEYRKKWFPDRGQLVTLEGIGNNVRQAAELFAKTAWLTQLSQESAGA
jgi:hypothetical protein